MAESSTAQKISFFFEVLKRYDQYINVANAKANLLFAFIGVVIFGVVLRLSTLSMPGWACLTGLFVVTSVLTILACLWVAWVLVGVVLPDLSTDIDNRSLIFFNDVAKNSSFHDYERLVKEADADQLLKDLSSQVYYVAGVARGKFLKVASASNIVKRCVLPLLLALVVLFIVGGVVNV